ncbi:hypothetical protein ACCO45_007967 [Purpureocillium lilacinum]|uniref:Uncharacterized protein n=1 Tax=Purpureocillium lilacinum TaxID=33203 RepID=A0ACC4DPC4_PURLI
MDGKCGPLANGLLCGGKWGDCCSRQGQCGAGDDFCSFDKCYSGNCIIPQPEWKAPWQVGDTPDGTCGDPNGYTCDVTFGNCWTGADRDFSKSESQPKFGSCSVTISPTTTAVIPVASGISADGACGGRGEQKCEGSGFGNCCGPDGWCGSSTKHCGEGCQPAFGTCAKFLKTSPDGTCGASTGYT